MSSSEDKGVALPGEHVLFKIHREEKALEEKLAKVKEDAKKIVVAAKADAEAMVNLAKEERLKKELEEIDARIDKENEAKKEEKVDDKELLEILRSSAQRNQEKAVELVLSQILPS